MGPTIPGRLFKSIVVAGIAALVTISGGGQSLDRLAAAYASSPTAKNRAALLRYAAANTRNQNGALAYFALARTEMENGAHAEAIAHTKAAGSRLPEIADYLLFVQGATGYRAKDYAGAASVLESLIAKHPGSPLRTDAAIISAKARLELDQPDAAIRILRSPDLRDRQPEIDFLLGKAFLKRQDPAQAAPYLQRVSLKFPYRSESSEAETLLKEIEISLGAAYPPPTAQDLLARAEVLRKNRRYTEARSALEALIPNLLGEDRERAELHIATMEYDRERTTIALQMLQSLSPKSPDVDAERLYYLVQCTRRLKKEADLLRYARLAREKYPDSEWTMQAHRWAGNYYLLVNDHEAFVPLFHACAEARPRDPEGAYCHWKVAWRSYLTRGESTEILLTEHLDRYPNSDKYAAALFFLGRWSERARDLPAARAYYQELITVEPLSFYAQLAEESLLNRQFRDVLADAALVAKLPDYRGKDLREDFSETAPTPETERRLQRAALLARVEMTDWVDLELRSYQGNKQQRQLLAMELAGIYAKDGNHFQALRTMKSMAPGYFRLRVEQAPRRFWELLFPMPYAKSLARHSTERGLNPHLVAGLIRQESEFKPDAVSRAKARGLMQVLPSTGRSLTRTLKLGRYSTSMLYRPEVNINMGTYYLARMASNFDGRIEYVLASYNAGKSRADLWKTWANFEEPIEFIETIPFSETREYVLSVMRNTMVYREVYPQLGKGITTPAASAAAAQK